MNLLLLVKGAIKFKPSTNTGTSKSDSTETDQPGNQEPTFSDEDQIYV